MASNFTRAAHRRIRSLYLKFAQWRTLCMIERIDADIADLLYQRKFSIPVILCELDAQRAELFTQLKEVTVALDDFTAPLSINLPKAQNERNDPA